MAQEISKPTTPADDLNAIAGLVSSRRLDRLIAQLDPTNVHASVQAVPAEFLRILTFVSMLPKGSAPFEGLTRIQRRTAEAIMKVAQNPRARQFLDALRGQPAELEQLGVANAVRAFATEIAFNNSVTSLLSRPQLVLKARKLFSTIAFLRGDSITFKGDFEVDDLLVLARGLLQSAKECFDLRAQIAPGVPAQVPVDACMNELKTVRELTTGLAAAVSSVGKIARRSGMRKRKRSRTP